MFTIGQRPGCRTEEWVEPMRSPTDRVDCNSMEPFRATTLESIMSLGEMILAGVAVEQSDVVEFAVAGADREIPGVALAVAGAVGILAAEAREVVHAGCGAGVRRGDPFLRCRRDALPILR